MEIKEQVKRFLDKLCVLYPIEGNTERKIELLNTYVDFLVGEVFNRKHKYNFDTILKHIQKNYTYKTFPNLPYLLSVLPEGEIIEQKLSGREGQKVTRVLNGVEYEFTIVPNHWEKVKSVREIERDIILRTKVDE